jgi:hypothetical protein
MARSPNDLSPSSHIPPQVIGKRGRSAPGRLLLSVVMLVVVTGFSLVAWKTAEQRPDGHEKQVLAGAAESEAPGPFRIGAGGAAMVFPQKPGMLTDKSSLTPYIGPSTVTNSYSQSNCVVTSPIRVSAGATLELNNCWIQVSVSDANYGMVGKSGRIDITHSLIDGTGNSNYTFPLILEGGGEVTFSEFIGGTDNVRLSSGTLFEWNYIHDAKSQSTEPAHSDGIEIYYGARKEGDTEDSAHIRVLNNYVDIGGSSGASGGINLTNDFGPIDGVLIEGNTIMPGNIGLYLRGDGYCGCGGPLKNIQVLNNRFVSLHEFYSDGYNQVVSYQPETGVTKWSGNKFIGPNGIPVDFPLNKI